MQESRGSKEFELGGQVRLVKFGTNQTDIFCRLRKMNVADYLEFFGRLQTGDVDFAFTRDLIYSALVEGARKTNQPHDFDEFDTGDWLDDAGLDIQGEIMTVCKEAFGPNPNRSQRRAAPKEKK